MAKRENKYQADLIKRIETRFPDSLVLKNDEQLRQGIPDLTVLHNSGRWGVLEVKRSEKERNDPEPNQEYYVERLNERGFASFIYPEIEEEVLDALQRSFEAGR